MIGEADAPKLAWRGVSKAFGGRAVLSGVDLEVAPGRSLVVIGGSGQGKSVLLKLAAGLLQPDAGEVLMDGATVNGPGHAKRVQHADRYGMLFQGGALFDSLSVWENVAFRLLNIERRPRKEAHRRALEALAQVGLSVGTAYRRPNELSGGQQKRAALARAVVGAPEIIFFDEPTTGLDPITADTINALIRRLVRQLGCTAVSITHDMVSARRIADDIAMLQDGRIVWRGPVGSIDLSGNPYVEQFINGRAEGPIRVTV